MAMPNDEYWQQRFEKMKTDELVYTNLIVAAIEEDYDKALAEVRKDLADWYQRFMENNEIPDLTEAKRLLNSDELQELKWTIEEYIKRAKENAVNQRWMKELENASARYHINRLAAIELMIRQKIEELHARLEKRAAKSMMELYEDGYYHTAFEIVKGIGIDIELGRGIDAADLEKIIHRPWASDGLDFSDRIWNDLDKVNVRLHQELTRMAVTGDSPDEAIRRMAKEFETEKRNAARLVQTEHAAMSSAAQKDCFEDLDVEQYKYVATLDLKTSELCQEMDGKIFSMNQFKVGETAPPMHPRCRSTTAPYFADMDEFAERWSRDPETGERRMVPGDMTYKEWRKRFVKEDR